MRLFTLHGGASGTPICGNLSIVDLDSPLDYQALSYTWGTSKPSHHIQCDGDRLTVNCNLFSALNRLREREDRWFVDFICINQSHDPHWLAERATQVRLMDVIYRAASSVLVDLGEEPEKMDEVALLMEKCCTVSDTDIETRSENLDELQAPPLTLDVWESFVTLCQRPWFQRIWVLQEYALAKTAQFMIGKHRYPEHVIMRSITIAFTLAITLRHHYKEMALVRYRIRPAFTLVNSMAFASTRNIGHPIQSHTDLTLVEALKRTITFNATDTRDRIYSLLGLIKGTDMSRFQIDYTESVDACSHRLSLFLLKDNIVDLFHTLACWSPKHPSWMIDLNAQRRPSGIDRLFVKSWADIPYNAGGREEIKPKLSASQLVLKGIIMDHVGNLADPFPVEPDESPEFMPALVKSMVRWDTKTTRWILNHYDPGNLQAMRDYHLAATGGGHGLESWRSLSEQELEDVVWDKISALDGLSKQRAFEARLHVMSLMTIFCEGKRIGICNSGRLCSVPEQASSGDAIAIFRGFPVPFLLRKDGGAFRLVGGVYLCGVMNGELCHEKMEDITLC